MVVLSAGCDGVVVCDHRGVPATVLIVDDHAGFRASARALLDAEGFMVIGEAGDGPGALEQVHVLRPDVVLLDIQLPGMDGFEVAERIAADPGPPAVVLISSRDAAAYGPRLAGCPVVGFLTKRDLSGPSLARILE
jgi:DNA-binding NarL/FixJ family response regulator